MKEFAPLFFLLLFFTVQVGHSEETTYEIDPTHKFPAFEADHRGVYLCGEER